MNAQEVFVAVDGNRVGRILEGYILNGQFAELKAFSRRLTRIVQKLRRFLEAQGGEVMMAGGDNLLARLDRRCLPAVCALVRKVETDELHFSIGVGIDSPGAYLALKYAKTMRARYASWFGRLACGDGLGPDGASLSPRS